MGLPSSPPAFSCAPLSLVAPDFAREEPDSSVFAASEQSVLLLCRPGDDLRRALQVLQNDGFTVAPVSDASRVAGLGFVPRYALLDAGFPGALELLARVNQAAPVMSAIALLEPDEPEGRALAAGATLTLRRPVLAEDVLGCLRRFQHNKQAVVLARGVFDANQDLPSALLESVLATIGHEIRNPLAAALASMECLCDAEARARLGEIEQNAAIEDTAIALRRIQDVMAAVSSLVKGAPPTLERVQLWEVAERSIDAVEAGGVSVELAGARDVVGWASVSLLEQVVVNLLQNAVDAAASNLRPKVLVRVYAVENEARISVRDNGPGVLAALRERIFEPFFTTKGERGTGLGLVLARHALLRMGGSLSLGPADRGAVFRVRVRNV
jgi:signal transduction histidine kinase